MSTYTVDTRNMEAEKMGCRIGDMPSLHMIILTFQLLIFRGTTPNKQQTVGTCNHNSGTYWCTPPKLTSRLKREEITSPNNGFSEQNSWVFGSFESRRREGEISCTIAAVSTRAQRTNVANGNRWIMLCCWLAMVPKMDVTGIRVWHTIDFPYKVRVPPIRGGRVSLGSGFSRLR